MEAPAPSLPFASTYRVVVGRDDGFPVEVACADNGNLSADCTLLLLHGLFDHKGTWELMQPFLGERFRTVALDLVGFGESSRPRFRSLPEHERYCLDRLAAYVGEFIRVLELDRLILVGNSLGGAIALRLACSDPQERPWAVGLDLRGLVLISAVGYPQRLPGFVPLLAGKPGALLLNPTLQRLAVASGLARRFAGSTYSRIFFDPRRIPERLVDRAVEYFAMPGTPFSYRMTVRNLTPPDIDTFTDRYPGMPLPALIVWGRQDRIVPALNALRFEADLPAAKLHVFDDCGHVPHLEYPGETAAAIRDWIRHGISSD